MPDFIRPFLLSLLLLFSFATLGCQGECLAVCVSHVTASGVIDLPSTGDRTLSVSACLRDLCPTFTVTVQGGSVTCHRIGASTDLHACSASLVDPTHLSLTVDWYDVTAAVGDPVTVEVTEQPSSVVVLDVATTVAATETRELCGQRCRSASVDLNGL